MDLITLSLPLNTGKLYPCKLQIPQRPGNLGLVNIHLFRDILVACVGLGGLSSLPLSPLFGVRQDGGMRSMIDESVFHANRSATKSCKIV